MAQSPWVNDDGLVIKFGTEEAASLGSGGHVAGHFAGEQICEVNLDLEDLTTSAAIFNYADWIPDGALVTHVRMTVLETAASGTSIDVGTYYYNSSGALTALDADGFMDAMVTATMVAGEVTDLYADGSGELDAIGGSVATGGDQIGAEITHADANKFYIGVLAAGTFTAGKIKIQVFYIPEGVDSDFNLPS